MEEEGNEGEFRVAHARQAQVVAHAEKRNMVDKRMDCRRMKVGRTGLYVDEYHIVKLLNY